MKRLVEVFVLNQKFLDEGKENFKKNVWYLKEKYKISKLAHASLKKCLRHCVKHRFHFSLDVSIVQDVKMLQELM